MSDRRLRVLHVLCDLSDGGAERLVLEMSRRAPPDLDVQIATVHDGGALAHAFRGVRCAGRGRGRLGVRALARLARMARGVDVVHTHLWAGDTWGRPSAALVGVPSIATAHHVSRDEAAWKGRVGVVTALLPRCVCAVSEAVARDLRAQGVPARKIEVVPNGVALEPFAAPWAGLGSRRALFAGRLVPQKGVDVLIAAARTVPEVRFTVAGDGPMRHQLDPPAHVSLVGSVDDVAQRLSDARVAVIPSRDEGFGLFAVEAMAAGTPVVASNVDGLAEVVGDAGILVPPGDPSLLAAAIRRVATDDALARDLSERGRARARAFAIEATVDRYTAIYRAIAAER